MIVNASVIKYTLTFEKSLSIKSRIESANLFILHQFLLPRLLEFLVFNFHMTIINIPLFSIH